MSNILIVAAHPDDEILGCGGTLIKLLKIGHNVSLLYISSGDSVTGTREAEAKKVAKYIGIKNYVFLRLKGTNFNVSKKNLDKVRLVFSKFKPDFIYVNHEHDGDYEHKIAYQLVMESAWRFNQINDDKIKGIFLYEVHKPIDNFNVIEDISSVVDKKQKAMQLYASQLKLSQLDTAIIGLNRFRGSMDQRFEYAEVFQAKKISNISEMI